MMMKRSFRFTPIGGLEVCRKINQNYKSLPAEESHHTIIEKIDDLDFLTTISVLLKYYSLSMRIVIFYLIQSLLGTI